MSVMLSLLSWFLLAMAAGGGLQANSATTEVAIASNTAAVSAYWHTMLPNTPMPPAILELLTTPAGLIDHIGRRNTNNVENIGKTKEGKDVGVSLLTARKIGKPATDDVQKSNYKWGPSVWGSATTNDVQKSNYKWGPSVWGSATKDDVQKSNYKWGPSVWGSATKDNVQKSNYKWGPSVWGSTTTNDVQKSNYKWGPSVWGLATTDDVKKSNYKWGPSVWGLATTDDVQIKSNYKWGPSVWGSGTTDDVQKSNYKWGPSVWGSATTDDVQKSNYKWGPSVWGSATTNDVQKSNYKWAPSVWGSATTNDVHKSNYKWGPSVWGADTKGEDLKGGQKDVPLLENGESEIGHGNHKHGTMSNMVFLEEALKPGSTISCYIQPSSTSGAPLLRRDVADSIPMSMENFTDILAIFAPMSNYMAADIWTTLDFCEHPQAIKGETKTCATSVESMVEFAASVLGVNTYNLEAFSSPDVPVEGVMTGRGYKVVAATRVTETGDTVTCHGLRFPFAMFMCHAVNPTRVYKVTLEGEDVGPNGAGQRMEVLAVCHLDTSEFDSAKMPMHVKPGEAPLCHFISRDSILLAPAAPASGRAAAA